jgi:hypothetical protein
MSEIKDAFKALTPEQQALVDQGRVTGQRSPEEWLSLLAAVAAFDQQVAEVGQRGGGFWARRFACKHDVPDGLRLFAVPLLAVLREDHSPNEPLELTLDLTGPLQESKATSQSEPYKQGPYHKIVDTYYDDPWIEGRARFVDGADMRFGVIDHVRSSQKTKRNPRGKIKRKTKNKKKIELVVTASFPARNYQHIAPGPGAGEPVGKESVKAGGSRTVVQLSRVVKEPGDDNVANIGWMLELIGEAYSRVDPTRRKKL